MSLPYFPLSSQVVRVSGWDVNSEVPRSTFQPDYGPPIGRPMATAMDEVAQITLMLMPGQLSAFRDFWALTARGGPFIWRRVDLDQDVIVTPSGGYRQQTILGRRPGKQDELVRITFEAFIEPAPVEEE